MEIYIVGSKTSSCIYVVTQNERVATDFNKDNPMGGNLIIFKSVEDYGQHCKELGHYDGIMQERYGNNEKKICH